MHITWGQATDTGLVRGQNEDAVFSLYVRGEGAVTLPEIGIFIVADGMGEPDARAKAAKIAVQTIAENLLNTLFKSAGVAYSQLEMEEAIVSAFQTANMSIMKEFNHSAVAVVTAAVVTSDNIYIGHVGDTVAVLVTADDIKQLTRIHRMRTRPYLTVHFELPEHRDESKMVNVLFRVLGQSDLLDIDTIALKPPPNSWLVLLSDGLLPYSDPKPYSYSTEVQITDEVKKVIMNAADPQQACDQLIALANERGGEDNASVIVIKVSE